MSEAELREAMEEHLAQLESALKAQRKRLGAKAKNDPDTLKLEQLVGALKIADTKTILRAAVADIQAKRLNRKPRKGRVSLQDKIDEAYEEWIIRSKGLEYDPNSPIELYSTEKGRQKRIDELKPILMSESKEWLAQELGYAATTVEELNQYVEVQRNEIRFLSEQFESFYSGRKKTVQKQSKGKEKRFKENNDCLKAAFKKFEKILNRPIKSEDFSFYVVVLEHYFPIPPAPEISDSGGEEWAIKTVRNYFEKATGLSAKFSKREVSRLKKEHFSDNR
ncbi:hypothetical protein DCO17_05225 [Polynucleobacter tropicus]|uniref:Uncharacterized protein n=1 Tax=Polynucleobacter tropicus TaxID=1743174 RepID=A0A6M9PZA9_9BURK|nr:hypothetical protein [Polynucleobacter tropicus]QKM64688.1 hypothetical protein DCO17_05225 [Polynucleobacter tropicus]